MTVIDILWWSGIRTANTFVTGQPALPLALEAKRDIFNNSVIPNAIEPLNTMLR